MNKKRPGSKLFYWNLSNKELFFRHLFGLPLVVLGIVLVINTNTFEGFKEIVIMGLVISWLISIIGAYKKWKNE